MRRLITDKREREEVGTTVITDAEIKRDQGGACYLSFCLKKCFFFYGVCAFVLSTPISVNGNCVEDDRRCFEMCHTPHTPGVWPAKREVQKQEKYCCAFRGCKEYKVQSLCQETKGQKNKVWGHKRFAETEEKIHMVLSI